MVEWDGGKPEMPEDFLVAIVGSGFSGLAMGVQLERLGIPYMVLERRPEPGGTWSINRYPDIRVDTISITYEFTFEKNYRWSEYFGRGPEVREYLEMSLAEVRRRTTNTRFERELRSAHLRRGPRQVGPRGRRARRHRDDRGQRRRQRRRHLHQPEVPAASRAMDSFAGEILHPARWPDDFDATGKRVAIIGNGSTGVQLLAPIAEDAEQVVRLPAHAAVDQPARQVRQAGRARDPLAARQLPGLLELVALHGHRRPVPDPRLHRPRRGVGEAGRQVQPDERQAARRPHRLHQGPDRRRRGPHRASSSPTTRRSRGGRSSTTAGTRR